MAAEFQNQVGVTESLRAQLALAVRSIQWSYAVFWSISTGQQGVLEWCDGYYNGDIKTRKTTQAIELNADQFGLQRSEQLRELYEFLAAGETSPLLRRSSAALTPEDLTDTEWYYLVCMSFVFPVGQGLPGRAFASGKPIWLRDAHFADTTVFSRSLLAKSASMQTVVCFPVLGGVMEFGVTEPAAEDPGLIQNIKAYFLENPRDSAEYFSMSEDPVIVDFDCKVLGGLLSSGVAFEEVRIGDSDQASDGNETNQQIEVSMVEETNKGSSQVQSCHYMDDDLRSNHDSIDSSDCVSQIFVDPGPENDVQVPNLESISDTRLPKFQEHCQVRLAPLDLWTDDDHYQGVLEALMQSSQQLILGPHFRKCNTESSFVSWKKGPVKIMKSENAACQKLLKRVLFEVPHMHVGALHETCEQGSIRNETPRPDADENGTNRVLLERKRREKIKGKFDILKSLIPSINKVNKLSVLDDTIRHLKELKRRVDELECFIEHERGTTIRPQDTVGRTSDDHVQEKRLSMNKRKACDIDETSDVVTVSVVEKDVSIEVRCPWRESLLLEILERLSNLHLDSHSVQSSAVHGILSLTIQSKLKTAAVVTPGMLTQVLQSIVRKV